MKKRLAVTNGKKENILIVKQKKKKRANLAETAKIKKFMFGAIQTLRIIIKITDKLEF
jgi:hypothetical protein